MDTLTKWCLESPTPIIRAMQEQAHGLGITHELESALMELKGPGNISTDDLWLMIHAAREHVETALARLGQKP